MNTTMTSAVEDRKSVIDWISNVLQRPVIPTAPKQGLEALGEGRAKQPGFVKLNGTFQPIKHKQFQDRMPSREELEQWFKSSETGVGFLAGWSNRLNCYIGQVDLDRKDFPKGTYEDALSKWMSDYPLLQEAHHCRTQSGGNRFIIGFRTLTGFESEGKGKKYCRFQIKGTGHHCGELYLNDGFAIVAPTQGFKGEYSWENWDNCDPLIFDNPAEIGLIRHQAGAGEKILANFKTETFSAVVAAPKRLSEEFEARDFTNLQDFVDRVLYPQYTSLSLDQQFCLFDHCFQSVSNGEWRGRSPSSAANVSGTSFCVHERNGIYVWTDFAYGEDFGGNVAQYIAAYGFGCQDRSNRHHFIEYAQFLADRLGIVIPSELLKGQRKGVILPKNLTEDTNWIVIGHGNGAACAALPFDIASVETLEDATRLSEGSGFNFLTALDVKGNPDDLLTLAEALHVSKGLVVVRDTTDPNLFTTYQGSEAFWDKLAEQMQNRALGLRDWVYELVKGLDIGEYDDRQYATLGRVYATLVLKYLDPLDQNVLKRKLQQAFKSGKYNVIDVHEAFKNVATSMLTAKSQLMRSAETLQEMAGKDFAWNELKHELVFRGQPVGDQSLRLLVAAEYDLEFSEADATAVVVRMAKANSFHPVRDYLNSVKHLNIPTGFIDEFCFKYLGICDPEDLYKQMFVKWAISAVARAFKPGCKVDTLLILKGSQGFKKSSFFKSLAGEDFFNDTSSKDESTKDEYGRLHRFWIHENAEFEKAHTKKSVEELKAFLTSTSDVYRQPYGKVELERKRGFVFCGTTNADEFLNDPTGSRRYWVIPVLRPIPPVEEEDRDLLWAFACQLYFAGEKWYFEADKEAELAELNQQYDQEDPWMVDIQTFIERKGLQAVSVNGLLQEALHLDIGKVAKKDQMQVSNVLKRLGWSKGKKGHDPIIEKRAVLWEAPKDAPILASKADLKLVGFNYANQLLDCLYNGDEFDLVNILKSIQAHFPGKGQAPKQMIWETLPPDDRKKIQKVVVKHGLKI